MQKILAHQVLISWCQTSVRFCGIFAIACPFPLITWMKWHPFIWRSTKGSWVQFAASTQTVGGGAPALWTEEVEDRDLWRQGGGKVVGREGIKIQDTVVCPWHIVLKSSKRQMHLEKNRIRRIACQKLWVARDLWKWWWYVKERIVKHSKI
jgi:hypothetical protein